MNGLWPIALVTFKEGIRNRSMFGISLLALLLLLANLILPGMIMQDVGKVAVDLALSTVSLAGLLVVLFIGINLMAKDLDKRTIYMVLARPVSRAQYIVGKFFGLVLLLLTAMAVLSLFACSSILLVQFSHGDYFPNFSWGIVFLALFYSLFPLVLLTALSFLFASFASNSFIVLILTIVTYLIGQSIGEVKALLEASGSEASVVAVKLVQGAYYLFPDLSLFNLRAQAAYGLPVPLSRLLWTGLYGLIYTALALLLSTLIFRRREFP